MQTLIGLLIVILIGSGIWFFFGNRQPASLNEGNAVTEDAHDGSIIEEEVEKVNDGVAPEESGAITDGGNVVSFTVEGHSFAFSPSTMTAKKGDTVRVTFKNTGGFHDFTLDEFSAQTKQTNTGESTTVEFVADKAGTFKYYCSVGNHRQQGMEGVFVVE